MLTERAQSETAAERQAREFIEQSMHQERAEKQTLQAQLEQIEQAHVEASSKLEGLTDAGFFARHALERCAEYGRTPTDVGEAVLAAHHRRERNQDGADWKLIAGGIVIVYDGPASGDPLTARVVSLWPGSVASMKR